MAIRNWHGGKIIICWIVGLVSIFIFHEVTDGPPPSEDEWWIAGPILVALLIPPVFALVSTWKWLTGREKNSN